ncbi:MAG TPA: hypothetical protein VJ346_07335 [Bacteroidales bacterium]|nr:hypothetical protein [Bacteroidales bacterium]
MNFRSLHKYFWILILAVSFLSACSDILDISDEELVNRSLYKTMKEIYLWYDKLPSVNPSHYSTPDELMEVEVLMLPFIYLAG